MATEDGGLVASSPARTPGSQCAPRCWLCACIQHSAELHQGHPARRTRVGHHPTAGGWQAGAVPRSPTVSAGVSSPPLLQPRAQPHDAHGPGCPGTQLFAPVSGAAFRSASTCLVTKMRGCRTRSAARRTAHGCTRQAGSIASDTTWRSYCSQNAFIEFSHVCR